MPDKRIRVFAGHFGSGKTEISINYAIKLAGEDKKACIVDLDIVNPYFSVREVKEELESCGIRVIAPHIAITTAELPSVPPEVIAIFDNKNYEVVLDVGGDDVGAVALGQYNRFFRQEPYDMFFVINTNRPFTSTPEGIIEYVESIQRSSRLKVSYLINNTNMSYETTVEDVIRGQRIVEEASNRLNIPVKYTCIREDLTDKLPSGIKGEIFKLKMFMRPVWLE